MSDPKKVVLTYFQAKGAVLPGATEQDFLGCAYLDHGIIDSLGVVEMVTQLEEAFDIRFEASDLESVEFQTVGGLIGIVERLLERKPR